MPERISPVSSPASDVPSAVDLVLHQARLIPDLGLPELHRRRAEWQRKHFLRTLAIEAGFPDWEHFKPALAHMRPEDFEHYRIGEGAQLKLWFATEAEARAHADQHGGRVLRVGTQAVVLEDEPR